MDFFWWMQGDTFGWPNASNQDQDAKKLISRSREDPRYQRIWIWKKRESFNWISPCQNAHQALHESNVQGKTRSPCDLRVILTGRSVDEQWAHWPILGGLRNASSLPLHPHGDEHNCSILDASPEKLLNRGWKWKRLQKSTRLRFEFC